MAKFAIGEFVQLPGGYGGEIVKIDNSFLMGIIYDVRRADNDEMYQCMESVLRPMPKDKPTISGYEKAWEKIREHGIPADVETTKAPEGKPEKQKNAPRYMVYVTGENMPKKIHMTYQSADLEAQRLAKLNPEKDVIIFKSLFAFRAELTLNTSEFGLD